MYFKQAVARVFLISRTLLVFLLTLCWLQTAASQEPKDLFDPADTSSAIDLAKIPLGLDLFNRLGLFVQDKGVEKQFSDEFQTLQSAIGESLSDETLGCLLKIRIYVNPDGAVAIPGGQLLALAGTGKTPIDALANNGMTKTIVATESYDPPLKNQSYYLWIKKERGRLKAGIIGAEWREAFEKYARTEVDRRSNIAKVYGAMESAGVGTLTRDKYWSAVAQKKLATLHDDAERRRAQHLVQEFATAQRAFNEAYEQFLQKEQELREQQQRLQTLQTISRIGGLVSSAIRLGEFASSNNGNASVSAPPNTGQDATSIMIEYHGRQIDSLTGDIYEWGGRMELRGNSLQELDNQLRNTFNVSDPDHELVLPRKP